MLQGRLCEQFLPRPAIQLDRNSLPIECFLLTYDLSGFNSRINIHLLTVGSFYTTYFLYAVIFCASFSCNSIPRSGCSALHEVNPN